MDANQPEGTAKIEPWNSERWQSLEDIFKKLDEKVTALADVRSQINYVKNALKLTQDHLAETALGNTMQFLTGMRADYQLKEAELEKEVRELAVAAHNVDNSNAFPHPGIQIKTFKTLKEYDPKDAIKFCARHNLWALLKLDKPKFEKYVKAQYDMGPDDMHDLTKVVDEPRATISRDLSEYEAVWMEPEGLTIEVNTQANIVNGKIVGAEINL